LGLRNFYWKSPRRYRRNHWRARLDAFKNQRSPALQGRHIAMKKPLCIYHGNCADGFTAAWAVWRRFGEFDYFPGIYQD
jgi:hypothetical protein